MYGPAMPVEGTFNLPRSTAANGVAIWALVPPFMGDDPIAFTWPVGSILAPANRGRYKAHVNRVIYTTGATVHAIVIARPLNFSVVAADVAAGATSITLADDPGVYSTNYKYKCVGGAPAQVADNAIASGDYIAVQLADGTWKATTVTNVSSLTLTVPALPNNGVGIAKGALCYFFGNVTSDVDPATGTTQPQSQIAANQTRDTSWSEATYGVVSALRPGDPLLFYSPNTTNAGVLEALSGFYSIR